MIDVNTTSANPTHFLRGVELVKRAGKEYNVPSENWPHPTEYRFGIPQDRYYSEIWVNGMDWQPSYWVIEEKELEKPRIYPFIIFEMNEDRSKFDDCYFKELIEASLWYRRDRFWVKQNDLGIATDFSWPHINTINMELSHKVMQKVCFEHASQKRVEFWMNQNFIPKQYLENNNEKNRNNRDSQEERCRLVSKS